MPPGRSTSARVMLYVDLPTSGSATAGALVIYGWAFSRGGARIVEVHARLGSHATVLALGVRRPDVALAFAEPHADWCGFEGTLAVAEAVSERAERLVVRATDELGESAAVEVPVRILPSGRPVLEVERSRWADGRIEVEGFLIWPEGAPPRTVSLWLGESPVAQSTPNLSRPDVARRFPGFPRGSCRGFRLAAAPDPLALPADESARLQVVCTDARGQRLEAAASVVREPSQAPTDAGRETILQLESAVARVRERIAHEPVVLDNRTGLQLASHLPALTIFQPVEVDEPTLPYLNQTIDIVVTDGSVPERVAEARRVAAVATVEGAALEWHPSAPPRPTLPETSIIVVVHGPPEPAEACLARLKETLSPEFRGEILVVDDDASGACAARLGRWTEEWPLSRLLRNDGNVGFARSCNRGAELARGELLVFLAGDTLPLPGWLPPLLRLLQEDRTVGAVGGKLLAPNGTLRAAGSVVFANGSGDDFGRGDDAPNRPLYSFVRGVDSSPASFLAVRRSTFLEVGGFDTRLAPADSAGDDFCLRLRERGHRVCFQPASVALQAKDGRSGEGSGAGARLDAAAQRKRFRARWRKLLPKLPEAPAKLDGAALSALAAPAGGQRVLICAPRMPQYDRECGSQRVLHFVELLQEAGWAVSYLAVKSVDGERYLRLLQQRGVATYAGPDSILAGDEYLDDVDELVAHGRFDLAILAFWSVAEKLLPRFRSLSPKTRIVVDSIDLHFLREERAASHSSARPEPAASTDSRLDRRSRELKTYASADAVLTVSTREAELVERETSQAVPVFSVPLMEELTYARRGFRDRSGLLFIGNFHHPPNLEGLEYLCAEILPRLDPALLAAHPLSVVGNGADEHVLAAVAKTPGARVVGWVPSIVPYLESTLLSLVPLLHGAGTKGKLIQALMVGTPSVSTSIGIEGLELEPGRHALVADSAAEFAAQIGRLATDPVLWSRLAREGRKQIEQAHGRAFVKERLMTAVEQTMGPARRRRSPELVRR